jgi:hypothetical protein
MTDITFYANDDGTITKCSENDGPTFLCRGAEEHKTIATLQEAIRNCPWVRESLISQLMARGFTVDLQTLDVTKT